MIGIGERSLSKKNIRQVIQILFATGGLLFLFVKAQPVDPDRHNALISDLREMQMRDIELGEAVLQHHYQLYHNYDGVVFIIRRMKFIASGLASCMDGGLLKNSPEMMQELNALKRQVELKAEVLEEFKSHNAVIKNSLLYLPMQVNDLLEELPEAYHDPFELLIRDLLLITLGQGEMARASLKQHIDLVDRHIARLPSHVRPKARSVYQHASSILANEQSISEQIVQLSTPGREGLGASMERLYLGYYKAQQRSASIYRFLLLLAAFLMLGTATFSYYRIREREQQLHIAAAAFETQEGILITDLDHRIIQVNKAFTKLTGYSRDEALGKTPELLKSGRHDSQFYPTMWATIAREKYWQGEVWSKRKNGDIYPIWLTTTAVTDAERNVTHYVSVFSDITMRKEAEEKIHQLAFYDPLTNLPNRRLLVDRLNHSMASGTRSEDQGAVLFIDLDNFKTLNDTRGHDVGDLVLVETAKRLQTSVRGGDTVARLGGDEFVVMLEGLGVEPEVASSQARKAAEKIREALCQPYWLGDSEYHSSCSVGISLFRAHEVTVDDLLKRADTAMYEAKGAGRNTLRFFDPSMQAILESRAMLEKDLRIAISRQEFSLYYQLQIDSTNRPVGAEALIRWSHPERGMVSPGEFIATAENTGLILPIGLWVLNAACQQIKAWQVNPPLSGLQVAVNVSARQFHQRNFVDQVRMAMDEAGIPAGLLKIELTESIVLDDLKDTAEKMRALKELGVRFSMDDFGTGYSSLAYLTQLPLDQLKIDQSFVRNINSKHSDAVIVQTIIGMAASLEMEVIAEGVETEAQRAFLENAGCRVYQGYLFGEPVALEDFESKVLQRFSNAQG